MLKDQFQGESRVRENLTHGLVGEVKGRNILKPVRNPLTVFFSGIIQKGILGMYLKEV